MLARSTGYVPPQFRLLSRPPVTCCAMSSARLATTPPTPSRTLSRRSPDRLCVAPAMMIALRASGHVVRPVRWLTSAASPVTIGAAKLVPEPMPPTQGELVVVLGMFVPGAATSGLTRSPEVELGPTQLEQVYRIVSPPQCGVPCVSK